MLVLRADPWMPDYGMGFDAAVAEPGRATELDLETDDWSRAIAGGPAPRGPLWFVDGVRRVELWVVAEEAGRRANGLFGTFAVGAVRCDGRAGVADHVVRRVLVLGDHLHAERIALGDLGFEVESSASGERDELLHRLQSLMQAAEARLVLSVAEGEGRLVLSDGPLAYATYDVQSASPVVGVAKRSTRAYLDGEREALLSRLAPAQRTPVFAIGDDRSRVRRYSWYVRLSRVPPHMHDRAGLVRCEVRAGVGAEAAVRIAGEVTAALPLYVGRAWDPRTPQNLAPVAGLETWLRHRMGDTRVVRRRLLDHLREAA